MTDSATATVEEAPTDVAAENQAQDKKRRQNEEAENEAAQRRRSEKDAVKSAHEQSEEQEQQRRQQESSEALAKRLKRMELQRERVDNYMRKKMQQYQPIQKKDRVEIKFDGADGAEHTIFESQIKKGNEATPFFGYYGKQVDKEASLAAVLKAVDAGVASVDVHGTPEQQEELARLAHEHGLKVDNYDMSKLGIDQDKMLDKENEAGVTGKPASKFGDDAKPDADAASPTGTDQPDPKTPNGGELVKVSADNAPGLQQQGAEQNPNERLLQDLEDGKIKMTRNPDGSVTVEATGNGAKKAISSFAGDDIVDAEFEEIKSDKALPNGNSPKLLEGPSTSFAPQLLEGASAPKQLGDGRITDPARMLPESTEDTPAADKTADTKKDSAAKQKKSKSPTKNTRFSGRGQDKHNTAHQTPAGKNGTAAFKGNKHNNFNQRNNSTHRPGR